MLRRAVVGAAIAALLAPMGVWGLQADRDCGAALGGSGPQVAADPHGCPFPVHHHHRGSAACAPQVLAGLLQPLLVRDGSELIPPPAASLLPAGGTLSPSVALRSLLLHAPRAPPLGLAA